MITDAEYQALKRPVLLRETRTAELKGRQVEYASLPRWKDDCMPLSGSWPGSKSDHGSTGLTP